MYQVIIKGEAFTDYNDPEKLDGIDCQDNFSEYYDGEIPIKGGYMDFRFEGGKLWTYTEYTSPRLLTSEELNEIADYTQGQWSDGIGEGFEQEPCLYDDDDNDAYISPWSSGQKLEVSQKEV